MSRAASCLFAFVVVALAALDAHARPIVTEAGPNAWWLVSQREPVKSQFVTQPQPWGDVRRLDLDSGVWAQLISVTREPTSVASVDDRLAILFDDGNWAFAWADTLMPGPPLENELRPLAIAGDSSVLWFLARSAPASMAKSEADFFENSDSASGRLWLVSYAKAAFSEPILLADTFELADSTDFSFVRFAQNEFAIVQRDAGGNVMWWRWSKESGLKSLPSSKTRFQAARAISGFGRPAYFGISDNGPAQVVFDDSQGVSIQCDPIFQHRSTDASVVRGEIRLARFDGKVHAQTFSLDGASKSKSAILPIGQESHNTAWLMRLVMMGSLLPVLLWSFSQPPTEPMPLSVAPAPLYRRVFAGLIDAPFILPGPLYTALTGVAKGTPPQAMETEMGFTLMAFSMAAYLFYTTVFEVVVGRTPGKMLLGLKVVRPDGSKPETGRMVVRNLSRAIEIVFFPLLLTLLMPSRQRMGDLIAGTVVVRDSTQISESVNQSKPDNDGQA